MGSCQERGRLDTGDMSKIKIMRSDHPDWVKVICPYNDEWLDAFKAIIPAAARRPVYDPLGEHRFAYWLVLTGYLNELATLFTTFFRAEVESDLETPAPGVSEEANPFSAVFEICPPGKKRDLYVALIKVFHPDAGGDPTKASLLNQAYRKERTP